MDLLRALRRIARGAFPKMSFLQLLRVKVVKQSSDFTRLDVIPDNKKFPDFTNLLLRLGIPGLKVWFANTDDGGLGGRDLHGLVAFDSSDPRYPRVLGLWDEAGFKPFGVFLDVEDRVVIAASAGAAKIVLDASNVYVGGESGSQPAGKGQTLKDWMDEIRQKFNALTLNFKYTFVPGSGGASLTFGPLESSTATTEAPTAAKQIDDKGDVRAERAKVK